MRRKRCTIGATMSKTRSEVLAESKVNAIKAGVATTATVVVAACSVPAFLIAAMAAPAGYFTYKWWQHRKENGIKF
jgi:hypothetical protein